MAAVMPLLSLAVNVAVLAPVLWGLATDRQDAAFGADTPSRRILIAVYAAILGLSAILLAWPNGRAALLPGLLAVQVAYKLLTVPLLGPGHPVARAKLAIVLLHAATLATLAGR